MNKEKKNKEVHLFLIWEKARSEESRILSDIKSKFSVLGIYRSAWSDRYFSENLSRFYGEKLPDQSFKERHCGRGEFLAIIVGDDKPEYGYRETSKGAALVNVNMFDAKSLYRSWTNGGHRIHASNDPLESRHDLALLLGLEAEPYLNHELDGERDLEIRTLNDLVGAGAWKSIRELFYVLNQTINYVVLRNFECLPDHYTMQDHGDIDLLVDDYLAVSFITNARRVFKSRSRVLNKVKIQNEEVLFDFRYLGDNYFDQAWQKDVLTKRQLCVGGFYRPDPENYFYSLLYHALVHKRNVSQDYKKRLAAQAQGMRSVELTEDSFDPPAQAKGLLTQYMKDNSYVYTPPLDLSVYYARSSGLLMRLYRIYRLFMFNMRQLPLSAFTLTSLYRRVKEIFLRNLFRLGV